MVRTLIGTDGQAQEVQLAQSSGFERLDQAALKAAREWRYVPGKRDGVPQAMWVQPSFYLPAAVSRWNTKTQFSE